MTYEEYADAMNAHADTCPQCDFSRKTGLTEGVCPTARLIIVEWRASHHSEEDMNLALLNAVVHELEQEEKDNEPEN